jgi:hypothetical protein
LQLNWSVLHFCAWQNSHSHSLRVQIAAQHSDESSGYTKAIESDKCDCPFLKAALCCTACIHLFTALCFAGSYFSHIWKLFLFITRTCQISNCNDFFSNYFVSKFNYSCISMNNNYASDTRRLLLYHIHVMANSQNSVFHLSVLKGSATQ